MNRIFYTIVSSGLNFCGLLLICSGLVERNSASTGKLILGGITYGGALIFVILFNALSKSE